MNKKQVLVKRLDDDVEIPVYAHEGDVGCDVRANEDVVIPPGQTVKIGTGLAMSIPEGYEIQVRPRSGLSLNTKLRIANSPGSIDHGYSDEIGIIVDNIAHPYLEVIEEDAIPIGKKTPRIDSEYEEILINIKGTEIHADHLYMRNTYIIRKGERIAQLVLKSFTEAEFVEVDSLENTDRGSGFGSSGY